MNNTRSKKKWLIFIVVLFLALFIAVFGIFLPNKNKTTAPDKNNNNINQQNNNSQDFSNSNDIVDNDKEKYLEKISESEQKIENDSSNVQNYIDKSEYEYLIGDKQAALITVEDGLKIDPNNELLKSRRDVLLNQNLTNSNQSFPKQ